MARKLVGKPELRLVEAPALAPQEVQIDPQMLAQQEQELRDAANVPLPDEDDDDI